MDMDFKEYLNSINLENICRTCLSDNDEMTSLFSEVVIEDPELEDNSDTYAYLYEIVANVTAMQALSDDGLPTMICKKCIEYATNAYKFKISCERTETLLQTYVTKQIDIKKEKQPPDHETEIINENTNEITIEIKGNIDLHEDLEERKQTIDLGGITVVENKEYCEDVCSGGLHIKADDGDIENECESNEHTIGSVEFEDDTKSVNIYNESSNENDCQDNEMHEDDEETVENNSVVTYTTSTKENIEFLEYVQTDEESMDTCNDSTEIYESFESIQDNNASENIVAQVASSDDNIKLREKIDLKKKLTLEKEIHKKRSRAYYRTSSFNEKGQRIYPCPVCKKEYRHSTSLTVHIRSHTLELPYVCKICGKGFKQLTGLTYHMRSHTGEQPYQCTLCEKKYRQSATLTAHMRIHTGQRPFLCSVCGKGFRQAPDLGYHMRTHTNEKPYMCNICGKRMSMQCHLVLHMRTHTGEKPYSCSQCGKCFASTTRLKRHEIIHTGLKPYVCSICGKCFNRASTLRVHSMIHSDKKPHVCDICGKGFIQAHCLKAHLNTHIK